MATSQHVELPGLRVHYLQEGRGPEPVVLLHGFPETSHQWRHQLRALSSEGYACFAPDNRGFGGTDKPDVRISRGLLARDVARFMDALGLESAHLVSHDWGGIIAFKVLADHPDRVRSVAFLDTLLTVWPPRAVHGWWFKAEGLAEELFAERHRAFIDAVLGGAGAEALPPAPASPWGGLSRGGGRPAWMDTDSLDHYRRAFADPASWAAAIQYYRYGLPFHLVERAEGQPAGGAGEHYRSLSEREVAAMWLHEGGFDAHPDRWKEHDLAPEDRTTRFPRPALCLPAVGRGGGVRRSANPYVTQFADYFPDLVTQGIAAGHFLGEEAPAEVDAALIAFLARARASAGNGRR